MRCHLFVALCDLPSIGLGVEFGVQTVARGKPTIAAAHHDASVTRLILDPALPAGGYQFIRYDDMFDLVEPVMQSVGDIKAQLKAQKTEEDPGDLRQQEFVAWRSYFVEPAALAA
ncbi:MAG: hypothetical protein FGM57_01630 [Candidatus Taylorbacteria bacterium]|nr:hypothetical protein [Candidatus Taylorbacteria bacterium]